MRSSKFDLTRRAAGLLLCLSACSKTEDRRNVTVTPKDSGADLDARSDTDGQVPDAGRDAAASGDASSRVDAALPDDGDGGPREPFDPREDCEVVAERSELSLPVMFGDESGFALTPGVTGFGVAYQSNNCGGLGVLAVGSVGEYPQPTALYTQCDTVAQGVSLLHVSSGYRLTFVDNFTGSAELQTLQLGDALGAPADEARKALTENTLRELAPVQAQIAGTDYLSWISQDGKNRAIVLQGAAAGAQARTLLEADAGYAPVRLALAQLGTDAGALAFVSEQAKPGAWLLPIAANGEPRGEPVLLSSAVSTGNSVDLATRSEDGGAVIYSVNFDDRPEVRFRRLNVQGDFLTDEVKVVSFPMLGRDASISRLGGGYVVAFRSVNAEDPSRSEVRLQFVTKEGNLQRDSAGRITSYLIAEASASGGRVTARVSQDGQLLIGFLDSTDQGPKFRLIRKRLDCAL